MVRACHSTANGEPARGNDDSARRSPKVTVLTLTYNRRHTLARVFDSLRSQTYGDFEWLVIDDGLLHKCKWDSTDAGYSKSICSVLLVSSLESSG